MVYPRIVCPEKHIVDAEGCACEDEYARGHDALSDVYRSVGHAGDAERLGRDGTDDADEKVRGAIIVKKLETSFAMLVCQWGRFVPCICISVE